MAEILITLRSDGSGDHPTLAAAIAALASDLNSGAVPADTDYRILLNDTFPDLRSGNYVLPFPVVKEGVFKTSGSIFAVTKVGLNSLITIVGKIDHPADNVDEDCEPTGANSLPDFRLGNRRSIIEFTSSILEVTGLDTFPGVVNIRVQSVLLFGNGTAFRGKLSDFTFKDILTDGLAVLIQGSEGQTTIDDLHSIGDTPFDVTYDLGDDSFAAKSTLTEPALIVTRARLGIITTNKPVNLTNMCIQDEGVDRYIETSLGVAATQRQAYTKIGSLLDQVRFPFGEGPSGAPMLTLRDGGLYRRLVIDPILDERSTVGPVAGISIDNNGRRIIGIERCEFRNIDTGIGIHIIGSMGETAIRDNVFKIDRAVRNDALEFIEGSPIVEEFNNALQLKRNRWLSDNCNGYLFFTAKRELSCGVPNLP